MSIDATYPDAEVIDRTKARFEALLEEVTFRDWRVHLEDDATCFYLQWIFDAPDAMSGQLCEQRCRKWRLSFYSTDAEVVQTAWAAALMAVEHEAREDFLFRGARIYGPHASLDAMVAKASDLDVRDGQG